MTRFLSSVIQKPLVILLLMCSACVPLPRGLDAGLLDGGTQPDAGAPIDDGGRTDAGSRGAWSLDPNNPLLRRGESHFGLDPRLIWNDPSVLVEGEAFTMWVSAGFSSKGTAIYRLRSSDGISWEMTNGGQPVLSPSTTSSDFDCFGVETPSVVKVGSTYHLYYSAYIMTDGACLIPSVVVTMGHATSLDGITWIRRGELVSLTAGIGNPTGNTWGWLGRAEPGALERNGHISLYFTDIRCRRADCSGPAPAERAISLAISSDGHAFAQVGTTPIVSAEGDYPPSSGWEGFSTPWPLVLPNGDVALFVDVAKSDNGAFSQVSLAELTSADGVSFTMRERDFIVAGAQPWAASSVRAPTAVVVNDEIHLWFAGDNATAGTLETATTGLGVAAQRIAGE